MFVKSFATNQSKRIYFMYNQPTKYFNTSYFLKQYPNKIFIDWICDDENDKVINKAADVLDIYRSDMFKLYFKNSHYDGLYMHPILTKQFLNWVCVDDSKYVLDKYFKEINKY